MEERDPSSTELAFNDTEPHLLERTKLADLLPDCCHWPYGDPLRTGFTMCGRSTFGHSSYCEEHHKRAYRDSNAKLKGE